MINICTVYIYTYICGGDLPVLYEQHTCLCTDTPHNTLYIHISYIIKIECHSMPHTHRVLLVLVVQVFVVPLLQINSSTSSTTNTLEVVQLPTPTKGRSVLGITVGRVGVQAFVFIPNNKYTFYTYVHIEGCTSRTRETSPCKTQIQYNMVTWVFSPK